MKTVLLLSFLVSFFACTVESRVVCYWGAWSYWWPGNGKYDVSNVDANLCTHVIYAFVGITEDGDIEVLDEWFDVENNGFNDMVSLKNQNSDLKVLVSIGGASQESANFSAVVTNSNVRSDFVDNVKVFLSEYGFDGLDISWIYPGQRGGLSTDMDNLVLLIQELRELFDTNEWILSASVPANDDDFDVNYDISNLDASLDFINVMTYDFHGAWDSVTGVVAPLNAQETDAADTTNTVDASVNAWIDAGASPEKLNLGLALYGRSFTLSDATDRGTGAPITGVGEAGIYSQQPGVYTYLEICESIQNATAEWVVTEVTGNYAYASRGTLWVGYDTVNTIKAKGAYAKDLGLGGINIWSLNYDDFLGSCGDTHALINAAKEGFEGT